MTTRHKSEPEAAPRIELVAEAEPMTVVLLEQEDGSTVSAEVPYPPGTAQISIDGVAYQHVGEQDDAWIYRRL